MRIAHSNSAFRAPRRRTPATLSSGRGRASVPVLLLLVFVAAITACAPREPRADLVIVNGKEPESLDPAVFSGAPDGRIGMSLFEGLTRLDPVTAAAIPGLAERWEISPDRRTYLFFLRSNLVWSTGEPIAAVDFERTWRRVLDPATACDSAGLLYCVRGAEAFATGRTREPATLGFRALDSRRFRVELNHPTSYFLDICAYVSFAVVPTALIEREGDRWLLVRPLPSSGAYTLEQWRLNDRVRLRRNPRYWDAAATRNEWVDLLPVSNPSVALNLYETGEADVIWDKDLVMTELMDVLKSRSDFHTFNYLAAYFLRFNTTRPPLGDPRVRRALIQAIDRPRLIQRVLKGGEPAADHLVPSGVAGYTSPPGLNHDPEAARQALAQAGFPGGRGFPRLQYLFNSGRDHEKIGVELQAMWRRELGIDIELRQLEWKVYFHAQTELDYDLCRSSWIGDYNDPNTFLDLFLSTNPNNRTGWTNAAYDAVLRRANAHPDPAQRRQLLQDAESLLIRTDPPIMPLYSYVGYNFWRPDRIRGIHNNLRDDHPLRVIERIGTAASPGRARR